MKLGSVPPAPRTRLRRVLAGVISRIHEGILAIAAKILPGCRPHQAIMDQGSAEVLLAGHLRRSKHGSAFSPSGAIKWLGGMRTLHRPFVLNKI